MSTPGPPPEIQFTKVHHNDTYPFINPSGPHPTSLHQASVFITGGSRGVGLATAISYASAGCPRIAIGARSPLDSVVPAILSAASAAKRPPPQILTVSLDVLSSESINAAAELVKGAFGGHLDILVNNAGYLEEWNRIADSDPADYWKTWEVNYRGVYLVTRAFLPLLLAAPAGLKTIVNVSSIGALFVRDGASAYQNTKFALLKFTQSLVVEYGGQGILSFALHPGGVPTDLALRMPSAMHVVLVDTPELGADSIVWLTRERREWLAGRYLSVTWDMEELEQRSEEIVKGDKLKMRLVT